MSSSKISAHKVPTNEGLTPQALDPQPLREGARFAGDFVDLRPGGKIQQTGRDRTSGGIGVTKLGNIATWEGCRCLG